MNVRKESTSFWRLDWFEADFVGDVVKLFMADVLQLFAAGLEFFIDLDGLFGHRRVRILRAADQRKIRAGG